MPLTPAQEAALKKFQLERQTYDNSEGSILRSSAIGQNVSGDAMIDSIDKSRRSSHDTPSPEEAAILEQAKRSTDQSNFRRAAIGGALTPQQPEAKPQYPDAPSRRTMDYRYEANNIPPKMGGGIGNLYNHFFGGSPEQPQQQPQQAPPQQSPMEAPQGGQNWAQALLEGFGAGMQGMSVPQLHQMQAQAKLQQFEVQDKMRTQAAQQNYPKFAKKMKVFKDTFWKGFLQDKKRENPNFEPDPNTFVEATEAWDAAYPDMAITQTDQDTFNRTDQGLQLAMGFGFMPVKDVLEVRKLGLAEDRKQRAAFEAKLFGLPGTQAAAEDAQQILAGGAPTQIGQAGGQPPAPQIGQATHGQPPPAIGQPPQGQAMPGQDPQGPAATLPVDSQAQAPLTPVQRLAYQKRLDLQADAMGAGMEAQAQLPADMAKYKAQEGMKLSVAERQAELKEQQMTQRGQQTLEQIKAKAQENLKLQSVKTTDATTLKRVDHDLRRTRDEARDTQAMARVRERLNTIPAGSMTFEQKAALKIFETTEAGKRVSATDAAKSARQLAAMAGTNERDVFRLLLESGAVSSGDLLNATKMADAKIKKDPDSAGSLSSEVLGAIHAIREERAVDPITDDINFALASKDNPEAVRQLGILRNIYQSHLKKASTESQRQTWEQALEQVEQNLDVVKKEDARGGGDPFAVTRAVNTAIGIAAKNSNVAVINPITGQVDSIALFEKNPKNTDDYIKSLQTQANSNPALKQGLQPIIDDLKDKRRRVAIQKDRFQSVEKKLPHNLEAPVSADGTTMEEIIDQIESGDRAGAKFKSNGTVFAVSQGPGGKVQISAELEGEDLTFTLEGKGKKRQWLYLDAK